MKNRSIYEELEIPKPLEIHSIQFYLKAIESFEKFQKQLEVINDSLRSISVRGDAMSEDKTEPTQPEAIAIASSIFEIESTISFAKQEPERFSTYSKTLSSQISKTYALLKKQDIEVINHTGDKYFDTMKVEVLEWEESDDISDPIIIETIEPSVYFKDKLVKQGKVIVKHNHQ